MTTKTKDEKRLANRVENAMDWDDFIQAIPTLHIVKDLHGLDQDGLAVKLDQKHKVAVHEFSDGSYKTVPALRSENYQELSHEYVYSKIHDVLDNAGLGHKVLKHKYTRSSGELHTDIVLDKAYKFDEKAFEKEFGVNYTDHDKNMIGEYRPVIRVRNSFIISSEIIMGFLRVVCSNGMIAISTDSNISVPIKFNHIGRVLETFNTRVENLVDSLFEKNIIENMMIRLEAEPMEYQVLIEWMVRHLGKQATLASIDQFHIAEKDLADFTNKWIAYNMITWAASNVVQSADRRNKAMRMLNSFMA